MKALNILTLIFGMLLILFGLIALSTKGTVEFFVGEQNIQIQLIQWLPYIIGFNFIGGIVYFYHSISTKDFIKPAISEILADENQTLKPLSTLNQLCAFYIILMGIWQMIRFTMIFLGAKNLIFDNLILFILVMIISVSYCFIPIILAGRNLNLNNEVNEEIRKKELIERHSR